MLFPGVMASDFAKNFAKKFGIVGLGACIDPAGIPDVVGCRNAAGIGGAGIHGPGVVSFVASQYAPVASAACTRSQSSGQPARPDMGDLRCFQIFQSGVIISFNLVEGLNGDRIEVSQPPNRGDRERVILANIPTHNDEPVTVADALADAFRPVEPGDHMTCGMCHRTVNHPQVKIDGIDAWVLTGIRLNSTVRGTIRPNGQIDPAQLDAVLDDLASRHSCIEAADAGSETCKRIRAVRSSRGRFPMDNPPDRPSDKTAITPARN
jgi:hypothetical protein